MGSWVVYGLGSMNQDLPAFVVLPDTRGGVWSGAVNWSNGYLPAIYQGTLLNPEGAPINDLKPPTGVKPEQQRDNIELLNRLNERYLTSNPQNSDLLARMKNYEMAFRMQLAVPEAMDVDSEPEKIKQMYGLSEKVSEPMGRKCLMARRLVERGVRFVQIYNQGAVEEDRARHHRHGNDVGEVVGDGVEQPPPRAARRRGHERHRDAGFEGAEVSRARPGSRWRR